MRHPLRARVLAVSAALVAVALVVVGLVVWRAVAPSGEDGGAPAIPEVRSAREMGPLLQHYRVNGRDVGQSAGYEDRSVWVFGDTVVRQPFAFVGSTGASTTDRRADNGISVTASDVFGDAGPVPTPLLPFTPAEKAFTAAHASKTGCTTATDPYCGAQFGLWPGAVVADPAHHRLLVLYGKLCRAGGRCSGPLGKGLGTGIAVIDLVTHRVTRLTMTGAPVVDSAEGADPTLFFPYATGYTAAALISDDDLYVYGDCHSRCRLARVPLDAVTDRSRWQFSAGPNPAGKTVWTSDQKVAATVISAGSAGNSVYRVPALKAWLNVYLPPLSNTLTAQVGASPAGPWSRAFLLYDIDTHNAGSGTNYAGFGHPEYAQRRGLVQYLTYYQQATYQLHVVKVVFGG
jgi:hypothetical protein